MGQNARVGNSLEQEMLFEESHEGKEKQLFRFDASGSQFLFTPRNIVAARVKVDSSKPSFCLRCASRSNGF